MMEVYIYYNRLLFSIYNKRNSLPIYIADYTKLKILGKGIILLDILINSKFEVINFYDFFYALKLKYNLLSVAIIEKVEYLILAKNGKIIVYNNKENITFETTKIRTSYLINLSINR